MRAKVLAIAVLLTLGLLGLQRWLDQPLKTRLPLSEAGIPSIQPQLDRLKPGDRDLVLRYLARSKGDVVSAEMADPDAPLTARTFEQAIQLQAQYDAKFAREEASSAARQAVRDAAHKPLQDAVSITVVKREILSREQVTGSAPISGRDANQSGTVLVVTYRLHNHSRHTVVRLEGKVEIRSTDAPDALLGLATCWISLDRPISTGGVAEVRCADVTRTAGADAHKLVALPAAALDVSWTPKLIAFGSGEVMTVSGD